MSLSFRILRVDLVCAALHINGLKCLYFSSYHLTRIKISRLVNHSATSFPFFFVCLALETVWSCTRRAPSTGTTGAVGLRTVTYACTVGFLLLLEGTRGTALWFLTESCRSSSLADTLASHLFCFFKMMLLCYSVRDMWGWDYYPAW